LYTAVLAAAFFTVVLAGALVVVPEIFQTCFGLIKSLLRLFQLFSWLTVTLYFLAMPQRVSPLFT
jgi:hypothetical protein